MYRWLKSIRLIQFAYRKYKFIKIVRMQVLYAISVQGIISDNSVWIKLSNNAKYEILNQFIIKESVAYSRAKSKYIYDVRLVNQSFTRNFSYWEGDAISNAMGRNFNISLPVPPTFYLFSKINQLNDFIYSYDKKIKKNKSNKNNDKTFSGFLERSWY